MRKIISILGGGVLGTVLAAMLSEKNEVRLWVRSSRQAAKIQKTRENKKYLPGVKIPESVLISSDLGKIVSGSDLIIFAVPSPSTRGVLNALKKLLGRRKRKWPPFLGVAKGIEKGTLQFSSQIVEDTLGRFGISYLHLSGPGFAKEIARGKPVIEVLASADQELAAEIKELLETPKFQIIITDDLVGVQSGGALKNVFAIGAGLVAAASKDKKIRDRFIAMSLEELVRIGMALGGKEETLRGQAGQGDLILTASSPLSRNSQLGWRLVTEGLPRIREEIRRKRTTYEGLQSIEAMYQIAQEHGISAPIIREIYLVTCQGKPVEDTVRDLMHLIKGA